MSRCNAASNGQRAVKSDHVDLTAIADLLLAGRGNEVVVAAPPMTRWSS